MIIVKPDNSMYLTRGDSAIINLSLRMGQEPYELAEGDECVLTVKESTTTPNAILQKQLIDGKFTIEPADTNNLEYGVYKYDVQLTTANGAVHTIILPRNFVVGEEVTW